MIALFILAIAARPEWFPARLPVRDYLGAASCAKCHAKEYAAWTRSPHGRGMADAREGAVLGAFDGRAVALSGGEVIPFRRGAKFMMKVGAEVVEVARVIGSGRQHQVYLDRDHTLLPLIWLTKKKAWISMSAYQSASLDPQREDYWRKSNAVDLGCFSCHLSQGRFRKKFEWTDLPINCESCHGPGRGHRFGELHAVSKEVDTAICAQCHARKNHFYLGRDEDGVPRVPVATIALDAFRADGTQLVTGYQTAGHLLSRCYVEGAMTCSSCHDPHAQTARDLAGESAVGADSNKQCTVCHRDRLAAEDAAKHAHHPAERVFCVDCHMPFTWMFDDPALDQRVADHSVSIPRPRESVELGLPNACTTCHKDQAAPWALSAVKRWGARRAEAVRPWVVALALAKKLDARAPAALAPVLTSTIVAPFVRLSALDATLSLPAAPALASKLEPFASSSDAATRSIALRALMLHDHAHATAWRARALADSHPLVRIEMLLGLDDAEGIDRATIDRAIDDVLQLDPLPPVDELRDLESMR